MQRKAVDQKFLITWHWESDPALGGGCSGERIQKPKILQAWKKSTTIISFPLQLFKVAAFLYQRNKNKKRKKIEGEGEEEERGLKVN